MPRRFCCAKGTGAIAVFRRSISEATTFVGWLTPLMPVRKVVTRSLRGKFVGAMPGSAERDLEQRRQRRVRHVVGELAVVLRLARR